MAILASQCRLYVITISNLYRHHRYYMYFPLCPHPRLRTVFFDAFRRLKVTSPETINLLEALITCSYKYILLRKKILTFQ